MSAEIIRSISILTSATLHPCSAISFESNITSSITVEGALINGAESDSKLFTASDAICHAAASPIGVASASIPIRIACSLNTRAA
ncbi:unannotated protein [freshwater metagenome]|uniref:Unannotated protein n=1 Tax=freshwater metagenome TaxID=449393 RepID=A0A6J6MAE4_9ZZZZ